MYRETLVTAKKAKRCVWCGEMCEAGEQRYNRAYIFQGDFQADCLHPECQGAMRASDLDPDDGFDDGQFERGKTDAESAEMDRERWAAEEKTAEMEEDDCLPEKW